MCPDHWEDGSARGVNSEAGGRDAIAHWNRFAAESRKFKGVRKAGRVVSGWFRPAPSMGESRVGTEPIAVRGLTRSRPSAPDRSRAFRAISKWPGRVAARRRFAHTAPQEAPRTMTSAGPEHPFGRFPVARHGMTRRWRPPPSASRTAPVRGVNAATAPRVATCGLRPWFLYVCGDEIGRPSVQLQKTC